MPMQHRSWQLPRLSIVMVGMLLLTQAPLLQAQTAERCFPETGFCISGRIREFWERNGGLPVFGFPIGAQQEEIIEGKPFQVQRFERNRLELHPENARPYDVLLGRLGADRIAQQGRDWQGVFPRSEPQTGCRYFAETGHNVCGDILTMWRSVGLDLDGRSGKTESENLALVGLPLSDLVTERMADGQDRQIQWFERARFELHPENQPPYTVLLGLLGNEIRDNAVPPAPKPLPPASFNACQPDPNPDAAPNYPVRIASVDKQGEQVILHNVSLEAINLDGWKMCSIKGNQEVPVSGVVAPGASAQFPSPGGQIWNNSDQDDGALYNREGQLVSYWYDR